MADLKFLENLKVIKFGPGVVGKGALAYFVLVAGCAALGWIAGDIIFRYVTLGVMAFGFLTYLGTNVYFVNQHPEAALLEGADAVAYHTLQAEAKGLRRVPNISSSNDLTTSPNRAVLPAALPEEIAEADYHE